MWLFEYESHGPFTRVNKLSSLDMHSFTCVLSLIISASTCEFDSFKSLISSSSCLTSVSLSKPEEKTAKIQWHQHTQIHNQYSTKYSYSQYSTTKVLSKIAYYIIKIWNTKCLLNAVKILKRPHSPYDFPNWVRKPLVVHKGTAGDSWGTLYVY